MHERSRPTRGWRATAPAAILTPVPSTAKAAPASSSTIRDGNRKKAREGWLDVSHRPITKLASANAPIVASTSRRY